MSRPNKEDGYDRYVPADGSEWKRSARQWIRRRTASIDEWNEVLPIW